MAGPWPVQPPLPPAVTFNYANWIVWFPDFVNVSEPFATHCFWRAGQLCQNNAASPVVIEAGGNTQQLQYFLNLLTCHIVWLSAPQINGLPNTSGGGSSSPIVGRISEATEGTVSVSTDVGTLPMGAAYYAQTKWGFEYWQASAGYRQARYIPPLRNRFFGRGGFGFRPRW